MILFSLEYFKFTTDSGKLKVLTSNFFHKNIPLFRGIFLLSVSSIPVGQFHKQASGLSLIHI